VEDTPEKTIARAIAPFVKTAGGDLPPDTVPVDADAHGLSPNGTRDLPRAAFVRIGEIPHNTVGDLKKRVSVHTPHSTFSHLRFLPSVT
jgi:hypothetical protein